MTEQLKEKLQVHGSLGIWQTEFSSSPFTISEVITCSSSTYPQLSFDETTWRNVISIIDILCLWLFWVTRVGPAWCYFLLFFRHTYLARWFRGRFSHFSESRWSFPLLNLEIRGFNEDWRYGGTPGSVPWQARMDRPPSLATGPWFTD